MSRCDLYGLEQVGGGLDVAQRLFPISLTICTFCVTQLCDNMHILAPSTCTRVTIRTLLTWQYEGLGPESPVHRYLPPFFEKRDTLVETKGLNVEETAGNITEAEDINSYGKLDFP